MSISDYLAQLMVQCTGPVYSQYAGPQCTLCDFVRQIDVFKNFIFQLAMGLVLIMIVWGAFMMMLSAGDPAKFKNGRAVITYAFIGLAVMLSAYVIVGTLLRILSPGGGIVPWNEIQC